MFFWSEDGFSKGDSAVLKCDADTRRSHLTQTIEHHQSQVRCFKVRRDLDQLPEIFIHWKFDCLLKFKVTLNLLKHIFNIYRVVDIRHS